MNRGEITNSQDYKATKAALEWWYSLPEEQRKATDIDAEPDIVDAYEEGVLYGWSNPNWISVEDELPKEENLYIVSNGRKTSVAYWVDDNWDTFGDVITHWIQLPKPPRNEEDVNE